MEMTTMIFLKENFDTIVLILLGLFIVYVLAFTFRVGRTQKRKTTPTIKSLKNSVEFEKLLDTLSLITQSELDDYFIGRVLKEVQLVTDIGETVTLITTNVMGHLSKPYLDELKMYVDDEYIIKYVSRYTRNEIVAFVASEQK